MKFSQNREKNIVYILSFIIPVALWLMVCIHHGMYPFGTNSILTGDITYQFIDYLSYFKSIIFTNNDLTYTFSKTMGGDMAGFAAYYLFSPFNFILLLFSKEMLPVGLMIMIIFKCGCMSLFFEIMLTHLYGYRRESLIFSITYSLMGYVIVYFQLYAYFDDMMLLPLIVYFIHDLLSDPNRKTGYIITLFLSIILNYYIGWMLCLFSAIYFIYEMYVQKKGIKEFTSFAVSSVIAGAMSAFVLLPSLLSLRGEKNSFHLGFYTTMDISELFSRLYTDSFKGNISSCLPNIYIGTALTVLTVLYFFNKRINARERKASLILILFMIVNLWINTLNIVWHGFNRPIGFPYRYSFILSFIMIMLSYKEIINIDMEHIVKPLAGFFTLFVLYSVYILIKGSAVIGKREIIIDGMLLAGIISILIAGYFKKIRLGMLIVLLSIIQLLDLSENLHHSLYYFEFANMEEYTTYITRVTEVINSIKEADDSFYRMEKCFRRSHNDSMQFDYAGLTHYSSTEKKEVISYMKKLGFRDNGNWSFYDSGSTAFVDSFMGIKYLIAQYDYTAKKYKRFGKFKYLNDDESKTKYFIYENKYALPLIVSAQKSITEIDADEKNLFEFQNHIADSINGKTNRLFRPAEYEEFSLNNLKEEISADGIHTYTKLDPDKEAYIEYKMLITAETNGLLLEGYFDAPDYQEATIEVNGDSKGEYFTEYSWNVIDMSKHDEGDEVIIRIIPNSEVLQISDTYLYFENMFELKDWAEEVKDNDNYLEKITSSHLKGKATLKEDGQIVLTFPYEEDWEILLDGERVKPEKAAGIFLSVPAKSGSHNIELIYHQAGRKAGIIISILALLTLIVVKIYGNRYILGSVKQP